MDILKDKRKIDKYNMELEDKISGRNVTDDMQKMKHKEEERKMRIKYEKNVASLKSQGVILMEKIANEEAKACSACCCTSSESSPVRVRCSENSAGATSTEATTRVIAPVVITSS